MSFNLSFIWFKIAWCILFVNSALSFWFNTSKYPCDIKLNAKRISVVEETYEGKFADIVNKIISTCDKTLFIDSTRLLTYNEILNAEEDLGVNFIQLQLLPLFDCGDNDFIVYHISKKCWSLFNIIDECVFKETNTLEELLWTFRREF